MIISILTLFPEMFKGPFDASIVKRAQEKGIVTIEYFDMRDVATDKHKSVDDHPYGGGTGMVLRVDIIDRSITEVVKGHPEISESKRRIILMDPQGKPYSQPQARRLATFEHLILICGHYEGVDERVRALIDEELSIGDYVLSGGEIPSMAVTESLVRLLPGVLVKPDATQLESFMENQDGTNDVLEYPQYTKPEEYQGLKVPEILLSGNHKEIEAWRREKAYDTTKKKRPDLLKHS